MFIPGVVVNSETDEQVQANVNNKSYDDLKKRLSSVLGTKGARTQDPETVSEEDDSYDTERTAKSTSSFSSSSNSGSNDEDDDEALSYFSKLANS